MVTHRRQFIKTASIFGLCLGIPAMSKRVIAATASRLSRGETALKSLDIFKKDTFTPYLNTTFRVQTGLAEINVKLVKISDFKAEAKKPRYIKGTENFSLIFKAPVDAHLHDNVYEIQHAALGSFPMFLVGIGRNDGTRRYEATVSRL
jgi:hypothetical protein